MLRNRGLGFGTQLIKRALIHHFGLDSSSVDYQGLFHHRPQFDAFIDFLQNPTSSYPVVPGQFCSCALCSPLSKKPHRFFHPFLVRLNGSMMVSVFRFIAITIASPSLVGLEK